MRGFSSQGQNVEDGLGWGQDMVRWGEIGQMERRLLQSSSSQGWARSESGLEGRPISHIDVTRCLMGWCGDEEEVKVDSQISDLVTCFIFYDKKFQKRSESEKGRK